MEQAACDKQRTAICNHLSATAHLRYGGRRNRHRAQALKRLRALLRCRSRCLLSILCSQFLRVSCIICLLLCIFMHALLLQLFQAGGRLRERRGVRRLGADRLG